MYKYVYWITCVPANRENTTRDSFFRSIIIYSRRFPDKINPRDRYRNNM